MIYPLENNWDHVSSLQETGYSLTFASRYEIEPHVLRVVSFSKLSCSSHFKIGIVVATLKGA